MKLKKKINKSKSLALKFIGRYEKSSQTWEHKEATRDEASDEDLDDDKMTFIIKRFQYLTNKNKKFSGRRSGFSGTSFKVNTDDQKGYFNFQKHDHFIVDCPDLQKDKDKKENFQKNNLRSKFKKSFMETWDELDDEEEADKVKKKPI